ncbi:hypothetical protein MDAP_000557 [Mitosporidium daphniae]|uniref:Uncharacterized protein n=1 Tax=Mitosporidium daphniae TaxID=1485682 RepID=A0A098VQ86_9MICR|nr:uncharacterized protein DI09_40p30 [Mitosporidium daphniae]KGG51217.1 hypothetical protein DI09_40p30 [Mitosporidium daphniae]|eukprot:XP_013237662.1 uncharacterized protein DI09_40p30 [Mitosporidium daphniae]
MSSHYNVLPIYHDHFRPGQNIFFVRKGNNLPSFNNLFFSPIFKKCALVVAIFFLVGYFIYQDIETQNIIPAAVESASASLSYRTASSSEESANTNAPSSQKIAIVTYFTKDNNAQNLKKRSFPNFKQYAEKFGYDVVDVLDDPVILSFYEKEFKPKYKSLHYLKFFAMSYMLPKYDWVMWADGDSLFLNQSIPLTTFTENTPFDAIFTVNPLIESPWARIINAGHYFLRNSPWTVTNFLPLAQKMALSCTDFFKETGLKIPAPLNEVFEICNQDTGEWWSEDQGVLQYLLDEAPTSFQCHVQRRGFRDFNSEYPWYGDGDLVLHFPGTTPNERLELMDLVLRNANFTTGVVDRAGPGLDELAPVFNERNVAGMYDEFYSFLNSPCK